MTEVCPYCGRPTNTKEMTEAEMEKALLSDEPLKVSPPCLMCEPLKPDFIVTSKDFKKRYEKLLNK